MLNFIVCETTGSSIKYKPLTTIIRCSLCCKNSQWDLYLSASYVALIFRVENKPDYDDLFDQWFKKTEQDREISADTRPKHKNDVSVHFDGRGEEKCANGLKGGGEGP